MGIYSSNVLRESYSVTDFASQIEPDESYNAVTGCAMAFLESQQNDLALFNATIANDFQEVAALQEGYEVLNEAGGISGVFEKIKEILLKLIAKIKGIFQAFLAKLRGTFSSNKNLYDDYVKQINKYYNWKDFKVKNFRKKKASGDIKDALVNLSVYDIANDEYKFDIEYKSQTSAQDDTVEQCLVAGIDLTKDNLDNDDIMTALIKKRFSTNGLSDKVDSDLSNMNEEIMDAIFEDADTEDEWKTSDIINGIVGSVLKEGDKIHDEIKKCCDNLTKTINKLADRINKEALEVNKQLGSKNGSYTSKAFGAEFDSGKGRKGNVTNPEYKRVVTRYSSDSAANTTPSYKTGDINQKSDKAPVLTNKKDLEKLSFVAGNIQKVIGQEQELVTKLSSGILSATKFLVSQARRVWASAAAYSSTEHKNEGYEFYTAIGEAYAYDFMSDMEALD